MTGQFERALVDQIHRRLTVPPDLVQVVVGPRQVGKTTAARAVAVRWDGPVRYSAADLPVPPGPEWIRTQWHLARKSCHPRPGLLVLDEVQKVQGWSETVKALWDEDRAASRPLKVLVLGSSALLLSRGTTESLAGRFFLHRCLHWSFPECSRAFDWDLDRWIFFGGYPGAAPLADDLDSWRAYVTDSLVEAVLARDVLAMHTVTKPALLRNLFMLAARFPAHILSYNKMLGQLLDAGNTTTLATYLRLLETAFLVSGLQRYSAGEARKRGSSPKLVLWNNALVSGLNLWSFDQVRSDPALWGRLVENAVGAHLINGLSGLPHDIACWRHRQHEVDFVVRTPDTLWAIEVKSGSAMRRTGLDAFLRRFKNARPLVVGTGGMDLGEFFETDPKELLG